MVMDELKGKWVTWIPNYRTIRYSMISYYTDQLFTCCSSHTGKRPGLLSPVDSRHAFNCDLSFTEWKESYAAYSSSDYRK